MSEITSEIAVQEATLADGITIEKGIGIPIVSEVIITVVIAERWKQARCRQSDDTANDGGGDKRETHLGRIV